MKQIKLNSSGFTLLEVMIALLVLSMGLAGIASLLTTGMRSTSTANLRSIAITHSQSGAEMMRANLEAYQDAWYVGDNTTGEPSGQSTCGGTNGCSGEEQANNDYVAWRAKITETMPDGRGYICVDSSPDDGQPGGLGCDNIGNTVIKIFWRDARDEDTLDNGDNYHRFATVVNP